MHGGFELGSGDCLSELSPGSDTYLDILGQITGTLKPQTPQF